VSRNVLSELKIPAEHEYVGVAKTVASRLASRLGFSLENLDELAIAVTQACESAIEAGETTWGQGASLKLTYTQTERGLAVEVQALAPRSKEALPARPPAPGQDELQRVAHEMIRSFVDDFQTEVQARRVRISMVKYLIG
jgi:hypothetical protein